MITEPSQTRAHVLAEELRDEIVRRGLAPGDLFMTDQEICERWGVSRNIVREAVGRLSGLGILNARKSKGLIVGRTDPAEVFSRALPFRGRSTEEIVQLAELRYAIEMGSIEFAVTRGTDEQCKRLLDLAAEYRRTDEAGDAPARVHVDLAFHCLLLEMAHNPLLAEMHRVVAEYFGLWDSPESAPAQDPHGSWEHYTIAVAVSRRDVDFARSALRNSMKVGLTFARDHGANAKRTRPEG